MLLAEDGCVEGAVDVAGLGTLPFGVEVAGDALPVDGGRPEGAGAPVAAPELPCEGAGAKGVNLGAAVAGAPELFVSPPLLAGLGARGATGTGKGSPAAATRTSPVTQTGVWSLAAE